MNLYVLRHGETKENIKGLINSRNRRALTKKGRKQAKQIGEKIKQLNIDLIICSPLRRTKQTYKQLGISNINVIYDERLMERNSKSMQYKPISLLDITKWYNVNEKLVYKNSEGYASILKRVKNLIDEIKEKHKEKNILFITHGDVCKAINTYLNNVNDSESINAFDQKNCELKVYKL